MRVRRRHFRSSLEALCMCAVHQLASRPFLVQHLSKLSDEELTALAVHLRLVPPKSSSSATPNTAETTPSHSTPSHTTETPLFSPPPLSYTAAFLTEVLATEYTTPFSSLDAINALPLLPTERDLWPESAPSTLTLPTLNLQYLSYQDFFQRNFELYRREAYSQIHAELTEVIHAMKCRLDLQGDSVFTGQSRMAVPLHSFRLTEVRQARVGESRPAEVRGEILFSLHGLKGETRKEWESLREHDVVFVVHSEGRVRDDEYEYGTKVEATKQAKQTQTQPTDASFLREEGVVCVRGCEVVSMEDEEGVRLNDITQPDQRIKRAGKLRRLTVRFDPIQYQLDMEAEAKHPQEPIYDGFNLLVRRDPAKNNFKSVLETTRELLNEPASRLPLPSWLWNVLLGRGNPAAAHYSAIPQSRTVDFGDTFVDARHVQESFPDAEVRFQNKSGVAVKAEEALPPYRLHFADEEVVCTPYASTHHEEYRPFSLTPVVSAPPVRFTPTQVEAIRSGLQEGLTVIEGPPGTGKTDVAVQVITTLYQSHPEQHVLFVARSNHALNDLFEKIAQRPVAKRHLLRLGQGERELELRQDYTRLGRIDFCLQRRQALLEEVKRLAASVGAAEDVAYSCETAAIFDTSVVRERVGWLERVLEGAASEEEKAKCGVVPLSATSEQKTLFAKWDALNDSELGRLFPFKLFFLDETPLFASGVDEETQKERARACVACINDLFAELREYRPFELLRTNRHRTDYILTHEARVVAMTCTHAALMRRHLIESHMKVGQWRWCDVQVDTVIVEEAGQILELETLIPLLLQVGVAERVKCRSSRWRAVV